MYDINTLARLNAEAVEAAKSENDGELPQPFVFASFEQLRDYEHWGKRGITFPLVGDEDPSGWEHYGVTWFVSTWVKVIDDYSVRRGPAWSLAQVASEIEHNLCEYDEDELSNFGFAIIESGPFQCHLGVYYRKHEDDVAPV